MELKKGDKFVYTDRLGRQQLATYTGRQQEVKGVLFEFFDMEDGTCSFFYPSEVCLPAFALVGRID